MKKIFNAIIKFFKGIFGSDIKVNIEEKQKYNINKNKDCNIIINDNGEKNEIK